jgi:hypothetical protein
MSRSLAFRRRSMAVGTGRGRRRGMALLGALALLALSAALLAGSFAVARATMRSSRSVRTTARVDGEARRSLAEVLIGWTPAWDSLAVGAVAAAPLGAESVEAGPPLVRSAVVRRIDDRLYVVSVDVRAVDAGTPIAERRARLVLERRTSMPAARPAPLARWSMY